MREVHTDRMHVRKSWRSGTSTTLPGWRATRVGPGQYPQYTRALYGGEAVGSSPSETTEHTSVTSNEPNRNLETVRQRSHGERDRTEQESLTTDNITNVLKIELDYRPGTARRGFEH